MVSRRSALAERRRPPRLVVAEFDLGACETVFFFVWSLPRIPLAEPSGRFRPTFHNGYGLSLQPVIPISRKHACLLPAIPYWSVEFGQAKDPNESSVGYIATSLDIAWNPVLTGMQRQFKLFPSDLAPPDPPAMNANRYTCA